MREEIGQLPVEVVVRSLAEQVRLGRVAVAADPLVRGAADGPPPAVLVLRRVPGRGEMVPGGDGHAPRRGSGAVAVSADGAAESLRYSTQSYRASSSRMRVSAPSRHAEGAVEAPGSKGMRRTPSTPPPGARARLRPVSSPGSGRRPAPPGDRYWSPCRSFSPSPPGDPDVPAPGGDSWFC
nr:hypothetical protein GCM10020093_028390 [Planobispora longispora]